MEARVAVKEAIQRRRSKNNSAPPEPIYNLMLICAWLTTQDFRYLFDLLSISGASSCHGAQMMRESVPTVKASLSCLS